MKKEDFAELLSDINEDYIQEAATAKRTKKPRPLKWGIVAACLCLIAARAFLAPEMPSSDLPDVLNADPNGTIRQEDVSALHPASPIFGPDEAGAANPNTDSRNPGTPWTIHYNEAASMIAANRPFIKASFTEPLNDAELAALMPRTDLTCSGYARFDNYGNLLDIELQTETALPESPINIGLADYFFGFDYVLSEAEEMSVCNGVEYRAYQYTTGNTVELSAYTIINDIYFAFAMDVPQDDLTQAKEEFHRVLECFSFYAEGKPDLSVIVPEAIPELTEQVFDTLSEAHAEPDFGRYMPSELPPGFGDAVIRRFKFQNADYLSGMWSRGLDDLTWVVEPYSEDDAHRLTGVNDKENYDLSLYPIPRADSVPEALREIVNDPIFEAEELTPEAVYCRAYKVNDAGDTDGWRMRFSVKYGDTVVSVSAKGVEPEWVYHQLMHLNSR